MAAKTRKPKQTKTCFIVRRYFVKRNQNVCCVVRNGESKEYNVTVQPDGRVTCLNVETGERCKGNNSKHQCYHVKAVLEAETKREERKQATKPAAPVAVETTTPVEAVMLAANIEMDIHIEKSAAQAESINEQKMRNYWLEKNDAYAVLATSKDVEMPSCSYCGRPGYKVCPGCM